MPTFAIPNGAVAQMVEQWTENPCVGSSILPSTTKKPLTIVRGFFVCGNINRESAALRKALKGGN